MKEYRYFSQPARGGGFQEGRVVAPSEAAAERQLLEKGVPVVAIARREKTVPHPASGPVKARELVLFHQRMAQSCRLGLGVLSGLELCRETATTPRFREILAVLREAVSKGTPLHVAMERFPGTFDSLTVALVAAGETAGILEQSFTQLRVMVQRRQTIQRRVLGVMMYPAIVLTISALCIFVLMWKTVPAFLSVFASANVALPAPTVAVMTISRLVEHHPLAAAGLVGGFLVLLWNVPRVYRRFPACHRWLLRLPLVGGIQRKLMQANFARTFSQLIESQMHIIPALRLCRSASSNYEYRSAMARATLMVAGGRSLRESFAGEVDLMGTLLVRSLAFGEQAGNTPETLGSLADVLDAELDEYVQHIRTLLEPAITVLIGGVVLFIMLAVFLPIFRLPKVF